MRSKTIVSDEAERQGYRDIYKGKGGKVGSLRTQFNNLISLLLTSISLTMFARLFTVVVALALFTGSLAAPTEVAYEQCNGGTVQCCNSTQDTKNFNQEAKSVLASFLDVDIKQITGTLGVQCTGVNVLAVGGGQTCTQQKVCCSNNNFSKLYVVFALADTF
jgi:Fungal hydrophobin